MNGNFTARKVKELDNNEDGILIVDNALSKINRIFIHEESYCKHLIAITPYTEDLLFEPKEMTNYFVPIYTELFIDSSPRNDYIGGEYNKEIFKKTNVIETDYRFPRYAHLNRYTMNRLRRVIGLMRNYCPSENLDDKILLCILPILELHNQTADAGELLAKIESEETINSDTRQIIENFLGMRR